MRTTLNGDTGPLQFGPIPSLTDLVHLPMVALHELCFCLLNHISCESLKSQIPLTILYGIKADISIIMMHAFFQSVYNASHNESFPSTSEEKHAFWVGFGESVGKPSPTSS